MGEVWVYTLERKSLLRRIHEDSSLAFRIIQKLSERYQRCALDVTERPDEFARLPHIDDARCAAM